MRLHHAAAVVAILSVATLVDASTTPSPRESLHAFLRDRAGFSGAELAALDRGQPITTTLSAGSSRELAVLGAILIKVQPHEFLDRYRDIAAFRAGKVVSQIARLSRPAVVDDLRALTLDADDFRDLEKCRVGDCKVRLPAAAIVRFQREVDWRRPDAGERATAIMREVLCERSRAYQTGGQAGLAPYDDRRPPVSLATEVVPLIAGSPYLVVRSPEFLAYIRDFPHASLPDTDDFLYWEKVTFGLKPVVSVTHVTINARTTGDGAVALISSKQIYASHYFDASVELTTLIEGPESGTFYLVNLNRSLIARLGGFFGGLIRSRVQGAVRDGMAKGLRIMKARVENGDGSGRGARRSPISAPSPSGAVQH